MELGDRKGGGVDTKGDAIGVLGRDVVINVGNIMEAVRRRLPITF